MGVKSSKMGDNVKVIVAAKQEPTPKLQPPNILEDNNKENLNPQRDSVHKQLDQSDELLLCHDEQLSDLSDTNTEILLLTPPCIRALQFMRENGNSTEEQRREASLLLDTASKLVLPSYSFESQKCDSDNCSNASLMSLDKACSTPAESSLHHSMAGASQYIVGQDLAKEFDTQLQCYQQLKSVSSHIIEKPCQNIFAAVDKPKSKIPRYVGLVCGTNTDSADMSMSKSLNFLTVSKMGLMSRIPRMKQRSSSDCHMQSEGEASQFVDAALTPEPAPRTSQDPPLPAPRKILQSLNNLTLEELENQENVE